MLQRACLFLSLGCIWLGILLLEGCQSAGALYKKGERKFKQLDYQSAIGYLDRSAQKGHNPGQVNFLIGESYRLTNRLPKAEPYYAKALEGRTNQESARFYYAYALKATGKYKEAAKAFETYLKSGSSLKNRARAKREAETLGEIEELATRQTNFEIENLSALNTAAAEFSPVLQSNELIFTSSRKEKTYKATGEGMVGLYTVTLASDTTLEGQVRLFTDKINEDNQNEGTPAFSPDGKRVVFARSNGRKDDPRAEVDLYLSIFAGGKWQAPQRLEISSVGSPRGGGGWDGCPAFSADGKTLYFASNREGTFGGLDLYRASVDASGRFRGVVNMGSQINTAGNEMFPYVSEDGKLYFASDGHPGLGGLDLFVATRSNEETTIRNLGVPLNSIADDFGLVFKTPSSGYFTSNREGGKGDDDIYIFRNRKITRKLVNYYLAGTVLEQETGQALPLGESQVKVLLDDQEVKTFTTDANGKFGKVRVEEGKNYVLVAEKKEYFTKRTEFTMLGKIIPQELLTKPVTDTTYEVSLVLGKLKQDTVFVFDNILYDFNKSDIRPDAAEELDKVVSFLSDNPNISVELSSHTDDRGSTRFNESLSQKRAEAAVTYIVSRGVLAERITAKGYGKEQLIVPNAQTEEEHQRNRRTEIRILEINRAND